MATVICFRWLDAFPTSYVRLLRNAVRAHLARPHRFICVTDNPQALDRDIEGVRLPDLGIPLEYQRRGVWPKLAMFTPGLLPPDEPTLFLDLDLLIRDSLEPFFERLERLRGFHALREWNPSAWNLVPAALRPDRGVQSSIVGFYPREQTSIHDRFLADQPDCFRRFALDQSYLSHVVPDRHYWPLHWTVSFKRHLVPHYPLNLVVGRIREPRRAKVVVFHGNPRPIDVVPLGGYRWGTTNRYGHGPVDWVRDYWLRHDESWVDAPARAA